MTQQCTNHPQPVDMRQVSAEKAPNGTVHTTYQCPSCLRMATTASNLPTVWPYGVVYGGVAP